MRLWRFGVDLMYEVVWVWSEREEWGFVDMMCEVG